MDSSIEISNLTIYYGRNPALDNINVEIHEGTFNSVVGPNGSGKTTLLKVLTGLIIPDKGYVKIFGKPLDQAPVEWFGYVPQIKTYNRSFPAQPIELVASGLRQSWVGLIGSKERKAATKALELVGAANLAKRSLSELSGGELQRIYLARSIVREPRILLLDEPATGIDMVCETNINSLIDDYNKNLKTTVIMVTHNWATARHHSDHALLLNRVQISYGPTKETLCEENLRKAFRHTDHNNFEEGDDHV